MINLLTNIYLLVGATLAVLYYQFVSEQTEYENEPSDKVLLQAFFLSVLWLPIVLACWFQSFKKDCKP